MALLSDFEITDGILEGVAKALGDTHEGLTGGEIAELLYRCGFTDPGQMTKKHRIFVALKEQPDQSSATLEFIRQSLDPVRYTDAPDRHENMRVHVNRALRFAGAEVDETGRIVAVAAVNTLSEAALRANHLESSLANRNIHPDVAKFCTEECLSEDYFHAVFEATKSIFDKIRDLSGLDEDGGELVDAALSGSSPIISINPRSSKSERSEQSGFANLIKGTYGMFRNPVAHEARVNWHMSKEDAEDLLSLASLIHRRLDRSRRAKRN